MIPRGPLLRQTKEKEMSRLFNCCIAAAALLLVLIAVNAFAGKPPKPGRGSDWVGTDLGCQARAYDIYDLGHVVGGYDLENVLPRFRAWLWDVERRSINAATSMLDMTSPRSVATKVKHAP